MGKALPSTVCSLGEWKWSWTKAWRRSPTVTEPAPSKSTWIVWPLWTMRVHALGAGGEHVRRAGRRARGRRGRGDVYGGLAPALGAGNVIGVIEPQAAGPCSAP